MNKTTKNLERRYRRESNIRVLSKAARFIDHRGLVCKRIPDPLVGELRRRRLMLCAGDSMKPNVKGLASRWFVPQTAEQYLTIAKAISAMQKRKEGDRVKTS